MEASDLVHIVRVLIPTDFRHGWANFGPLAHKNTWKGVLLELPANGKLSAPFLYMFWDNQFETWHIYLVGAVTHQVRVSFQFGHFDLLYSQK